MMPAIQDCTINFSRCIFIDAPIDEALVKRLTPMILRLRQESDNPITVAIDSPGGSMAILETLIGLISGPNQAGDSCRMIAVVTRHAYSAAAILLAKSDYAVALEHTQILFHDVRYGGLDDVTPSTALLAAKELQTTNEKTALDLATRMFSRWMWNYLDLRHKFDEDTNSFPEDAAEFSKIIALCALPSSDAVKFDLDKFALSLFARLSRSNEVLIKNAMVNLQHWGSTIALAQAVPRYKKEHDEPGVLDGALQLFKKMAPDLSEPFGRKANADDLTLLITTLLSRLALRPKLATKPISSAH